MASRAARAEDGITAGRRAGKTGLEERQTDISLETLTGFRTALRQVMRAEPRLRPMMTAGASLERMPSDAEPPRMMDAQVIEDATLRARRVRGTPEVGFAAFLDGAQESHVEAWVGVAPIVVGRVAAVIRERVARRLITWGAPIVERRIYVPFAYTPSAPWANTFPADALADTSRPSADGEMPAPHPTLLLERAKQRVQHDRERVERRLAERWCGTDRRPLFIDGSISGSDTVSAAACAVGVVKSHRTLYASDEAVERVMGLDQGERSSVFRVDRRNHRSVYSWYLRLRDHAGRDAMWGLVRVEVAECADVTTRADTVSRWVLAESAPLAVPDARWDKMMYGVRDCEEYLKAIG